MFIVAQISRDDGRGVIKLWQETNAADLEQDKRDLRELGFKILAIKQDEPSVVPIERIKVQEEICDHPVWGEKVQVFNVVLDSYTIAQFKDDYWANYLADAIKKEKQ